MKIMGIDYGDARTGVAISDLLCTLVGSATVVPSRNTEKAIADIVRLAQENQVGAIVVGLPKNMDGTEGVRAELCRWKPTIFCPSTIITGKSGRTRWMPWRRP